MFAYSYRRNFGAAVLLVFFTLLMACQTTDTTESTNQYIATQLDQIGVDSRVDDRGLIVVLPLVFFDFDSSNLKSEARSKLAEVAHILSQPRAQMRQIVIEGHSDNIGEPSYNLTLSAKRAEAVQKELVFSNLSADRLASSGKGETSPISDNSSIEGRKRNRRVEIVVLNPG